jgi:hypothetical protein
MSLQISLGKDKFDNRPKQILVRGFSEFKESINKLRSLKKGETYFSSAFNKGRHKDAKKYPDVAHYRCKELALPRAFIAFDFDWVNSPETYKQLLGLLARYQGFGYETWSHMPTNPRARAILALSRTVNADESVIVSKQIQKTIELNIGIGKIKFDESVYKLEQPIYTPPKDAKFYDFDGVVVDVEKTLSQASVIDSIQKCTVSKAILSKIPPDETPRQITQLKEMLGFISADCEYETYRRVVWAILSTQWSCAEDLAYEWSKSAPEVFDDRIFWDLVNHFDPDRANCPSVGSIRFLAEDGGWRGA